MTCLLAREDEWYLKRSHNIIYTILWGSQTGYGDEVPLSEVNGSDLSVEMQLQTWQSHISTSVAIMKENCRSGGRSLSVGVRLVRRALSHVKGRSFFFQALRLTRVLTWPNLPPAFVGIAETFALKHVSFQTDVFLS